MSSRLVGAALFFALLTVAAPASAKRFGFSTPGRSIYGHDESFSSIVNHNRRKWVVEVGIGHGAEGNLGISLGYLVNAPQGLELYAGFGTRVGPVLHSTASMRYFLPFLAYRGYVALGYLYQSDTNIDMSSHSVYSEIGFKWLLRPTFHMTLGVGIQRIFSRSIADGSPLKEPDVDPMFLEQQLDSVGDYRALVSLRFSRAF